MSEKLKFNLFQSLINEVRISYEYRYNPKRGIEITGSYTYNRNNGGQISGECLACNILSSILIYKGYGAFFTYKFYYPKTHMDFYWGPLIFFKHKYFNQQEIVYYGDGTTYAGNSRLIQSEHVNIVEVSALTGMEFYLFKQIPIDFYSGLGVRYRSGVITTDKVLSYYNSGGYPEEGPYQLLLPVFHFGLKLGYAFHKDTY